MGSTHLSTDFRQPTGSLMFSCPAFSEEKKQTKKRNYSQLLAAIRGARTTIKIAYEWANLNRFFGSL